MGRGRPKGSKNKPKVPPKPVPEAPPKRATDQDFDQVVVNAKKPGKAIKEAESVPSTPTNNQGRSGHEAGKRAAENGASPHVSPSKQSKASKKSRKEEPVIVAAPAEPEPAEEDDLELVEEEEEEDAGGADAGAKPVKIIRLGTEEVKKYAILSKKGDDEGQESDEDDFYDDRYNNFNEDEGDIGPEGEDYADKEPEDTSLKVIKKYPSKRKFPCPKCPKIWNWPWELRRHLLVHFKTQKLDEKDSYKCPHCDKRFQWKRDMTQHSRIHTGDKILVCSVCRKHFVTRQALLHHVVVHTGEKPFQCAVCGNKFTQPANLRSHVKNKHNYNFDANKQNKCEYCGEPHASVVALHQHLLEDHPQQVQEEREYLAKEKAEKLAEKEREKVAKEERRLKREQSGRKPRSQNKTKGKKLKEWQIEHEFYIGDGLIRGVDWDRTPSNGEIACSQCDRKFGWRYEIMFHGLCHLEDEQGNAKNKICPECDTPFKVPIGLKHHLITHTGETPFLCLHCWKSFSSHIDLKLHIKKEHLMHLNAKTGPAPTGQTPTPTSTPAKRLERVEDKQEKFIIGDREPHHYVQLEDGTYAEMLTSDEPIVEDGQEIVINEARGESVVVVNPTFHPSEQIIIPEQTDTVYVIASQNDANAILPDNVQLENVMSNQQNIEYVEEDGEKKYIMDIGHRETSIIIGVE